MLSPVITIVIPAYRAAHKISPTLEALRTILDGCQSPYEIIVVIDGEVDDTQKKVDEFGSERVRIIKNELNMGKGNALRKGILAADGRDYIGYVDADLDIDPKSLVMALDKLESCKSLGLVAGSKLHPDSTVQYPPFRKIQSKFFANFVSEMFDLDLKDTQSGLKLGRSGLMKAAAVETKSNGFIFDLELLAHLQAKQCVFDSVPIALNYQFESTISLRSYFTTVGEVLKVYRMTRMKTWKPKGPGGPNAEL